MRFIKLFFICVFLFSCAPKNMEEDDDNRDSRPRDTESRETETRETKITNRDSSRSNDRSAELRRLKSSSSPVIRSFLQSRYSNPSYNYGGDPCEDFSSCVDICETSFASKYRRKCEKAPAEFIENLEEDLFKLISISDLDEVDISPAFITAVLNFDSGLLTDLIKQNMSEGDLKTFLAWVAVNEKVSTAFSKDRDSRDILEAAFEKLGELNDAKKEVKAAFNIGLIAENDTFLSLSSDEGNEEGFSLAYKILEGACSNKDCKLDILCSREKQSSSISRIFGNSRDSASSCKTSTNPERRVRPGQTCYIQGSNVWSFLEELIDEEDIKDSDFNDDTVTVVKCNQFCGTVSDNNSKCGRIL